MFIIEEGESSPFERFERIREFIEMIEKFRVYPRKYLPVLKKNLDDPLRKNFFYDQVAEENAISFDTVWEGSRSLLHTFEQETDSRFQKADLNLLFEDLEKLIDCICPRTFC